MSGVIEVANVDSPDGNADDGDNLRQLLAELVQLLLQWSLDLLSLRHFSTDLTNGSVQTSADDQTAGLAGGDVGTREQDVLLVLWTVATRSEHLKRLGF